RDRFPDGVWLVEFARLFDPALVPQAVASTLDVSEQPGQPFVSVLASALRSKALLLVLDNCEHLVEPIAALAETLLQACPQLKILATSREHLGIAGEATFAVPPLATPKVLMLSSTTDLQPDAVQMFADRAREVWTDFTVSRETAPLIASI